jgi:hypothetical protein
VGALGSLRPEKRAAGTYWVPGWMSPRADLFALDKKKKVLPPTATEPPALSVPCVPDELFEFLVLETCIGCIYLRHHEDGYNSSLVAGFLSRHPAFDAMSGHMGFRVDRITREQVFPLYVGFPCQFSFHQLLHGLVIESVVR